MAHIKEVKISNDTYLIEPAVYAATAGTASAITAAVSNFALDTGVIVTLKITTTNAADATLNVNSTGAKTLKYNNANLVASVLKVNRFYSFVYDGTYWQLIGELDTNTWRGIQDNLTSSTNTTESLSAKQGYLLANGSARDDTKLPYSGFAYYSNTNGNNNGKYYKISINSTLSWMLNFTIKLYHAYRAYDLQISGYQYGSRYWYSPNAIILGASSTDTIKVLFGYDSANHLWVAIPALQYTGISVISMTNGYTQIEQADLKNLFTIEMVEGEPTTKQTEITAYRPWYRDEIIPIANGGTGATTASDARTNLGLGSMATETAADYLKWQTTSEKSTELYNFGAYVNQGGAAQSGPTNNSYFALINIPYRRASGNTTPDYSWQIGGNTDNNNRLWFRTAAGATFGNWQEIAHAPYSTNDIGSATQPVYMTKTGVITAGTALKALAYKDNLVASDIPDISETYATKSYVNNAFAANDAMIFKGTIAGGSTGDYGALTAAANRGDTYKVSTAGKINGVTVEVGDLIICTTDSTAAATADNYSTIVANWTVVQNNVDGAVFKGANAFTDGDILLADGTNGKIKDSGIKFDGSTTTKWLTQKGTWSTPTAAQVGAASNSHTHYELSTIGDKRNENTTPNSYSNRLIFQGLKRNSEIGAPYTDTYSYIVGLRGWSDSSGGNSHELAFNTNGIYRRQGATTEWGNWFHLLDSNNYTNYAIAKTAGVTAVTWDSTDKKITKTINDSTTDVLTFEAGSNISLTAETNKITIANTYSYTLPLAANGTRGGIQIGYTTSGTNYAVQLSSEKAYVSVPWTDTKVKQTLQTTNANYKLLTTTSASPTSGSAAEAYYSANITANPSTGSISAVRHTLNLSGTDKAYMVWNNTDQSIDFIFE